MEPSEIEFLAEKENVNIVPNFSHNKICLISGDIGPFNPGLQVTVPLWLAVNLKQRRKCKILAPEWMDVDKLEAKKVEETDSKFFTEMPNQHYMEIVMLLLRHAPDDIPKGDKIRSLVKDIWDLRIAKLRSSIDIFVKSDSTHAKMNHLTLMELGTVRNLLSESMDHIQLLRSSVGSVAGSNDSQSQD